MFLAAIDNRVILHVTHNELFSLHAVTPTLELFLEQLELSAEALEDYGISVAKVITTSQTLNIIKKKIHNKSPLDHWVPLEERDNVSHDLI